MDIAARIITEDRETRHAKPEYIQYLNLALFVGFLFSLGFARFYISAKDLGMLTTSPRLAKRAISSNLVQLKANLTQQFKVPVELQDFQIKNEDSHVVVEFSTFELFDSGQAEIDRKNQKSVAELARVIFKAAPKSNIEIEGFTDDTRLLKNKNNFPSNWELSSSRAVAIMRVFEDVGYKSEQLKVAGRGPSRPKYENRTASGEPIRENQAKNRRVVIHIGN